MNALRRLLMLVMAFWLPLANAWALLSPCAHEPHGAPAAQPEAMPCHDGASGNTSTATHSCDCAHCHLSAAPALPSAKPCVIVRTHAVEHPSVLLAHTLFIARLPLPPPVE